MKFWDASAIVPLLKAEPSTKTLQGLCEKDPTMIVSWATEVECASAIARLERDAALDDAAARQAFDRLKDLAHAWHEVDASDPIREAAVRFLRVHPLRAADALQLAAAFLSPRNVDRHHSRWSHSTTGWPSLREKRDSYWSRRQRPKRCNDVPSGLVNR